MRYDSTRNGVTRTTGFNGRALWRQAADGQVSVLTDPDSLRQGVTTAYVNIRGFFYPDRFPARFRYLREVSDGGRAFDVIEVAPKGGLAFPLWFDRKTHRLARIIDEDGGTWVGLSEDTRNGPAWTAARAIVHKADGTVVEDGHVATVRYEAQPQVLFDPPAAP
jgi:hypothetical protein